MSALVYLRIFAILVFVALAILESAHDKAIGGMCMAAELSARLGRLSIADVERVRSLLAALQLPTMPPQTIRVDD